LGSKTEIVADAKAWCEKVFLQYRTVFPSKTHIAIDGEVKIPVSVIFVIHDAGDELALFATKPASPEMWI
jgi:hypothetical protein